MVSRPPYAGLSRRLVLAFDVGTTFSGVSYSVLDPGLEPKISQVLQFPFHTATTGNYRVPSIIWYDADGKVAAIGAGAVVEGIDQMAEAGNWTKVEWFKLHLRPKTLDAEEFSKYPEILSSLPVGKTIVDVFADYYAFLYESWRSYFESHYSTGKMMWTSVQSNILFILSHPNGWEGPQQSQMREAAVLAGLVPDTEEGKDRVLFVTEGEASLHFCINQGLMTEKIKNETRILIVDAGGGTIDISSYEKQEDREGSFSELAAPECKIRGSIFVKKRAEKYLKGYLLHSSFKEDAPVIAERFDKSGKLTFRQKEAPFFIQFGRARDHDPAHNIRSGSLRLPGDVVASFFQSSIGCIVDTIRKHYRAYNIRTVFLVGGFAANDWLFYSVQAAVRNMDIEVSRPVNETSKAVAIGIASFYIDHFVSTRISRFDYGTNCSLSYDSDRADHIARQAQRYTSLDGQERIGNAFDIILPKNSRVNEKMEFKSSFSQLSTSVDSLRYVTTKVYYYHGAFDCPNWMDEDADNFGVVCRIEADTSVASAALPARRRADGQIFFKLVFDIVFLFGLTEFKAQFAWKEGGVERRGPARVVFEPIKRRLHTPINISPRPKEFRGSQGLVLAFNVGTSFSSISYSALEPRSIPEVKQVTRYPSQNLERGTCNVPSIIWYGANGEVRAIGADAVRDGIDLDATDGHWTKVERFKLDLRPPPLGVDGVLQRSLPAGKTTVDILADYYRFLYKGSKAFIEASHPRGRTLWASAQSDVTFVLSHPDVWEDAQQCQMQDAALLAGLVPDTDEGRSRIQFVREGEANLHFCINQRPMAEVRETEHRFLVVDAGRDTINISSYEKREDKEGAFSRIAAPECKLGGSSVVTQNALKYIEDYLRDSPFSSDISDIIERFDKSTRLIFCKKEDPTFIKFGLLRDNDQAHNIRCGQLKIQGDIVATFFQSSIDSVVDTILTHFRDHNITVVFLIGSFAASNWLFNNVRDAVHDRNIGVFRPDRQAVTVADGAVAYRMVHHE